jgi:hypothetical protein
MESTTVTLTECEYDCEACQSVHRYSDGEVFEIHADLRMGEKRWIYEAVAE